MGYARRASSGNATAKGIQRRKTHAHKGLSIFASSGHHSYPKSRGKRNPTGATTHAPKEWGREHRKEEEHLTGLARQAELDAVREGLAEAWGHDPGSLDSFMEDLNEEFLESVYFDVPGVTLNGQPLAEDYDDYGFDYDDECPHCGRRY